MSRLVDLGFSIEGAALAGERATREQLSIATRAVSEITRAAEQQLEARTREAVPGRLWRAWKSETFPRRGPAREPAGTIFINGGSRSRGAIDFLTSPGRIQKDDGGWLAIPLPAAGPRGRTRNLTPGEWERQNGARLRFVYRPGKSALLVADLGTTNARTGTFRPITRARRAADERRGFLRGEQTVPIFVLVPFVPFRNAFAINDVLDPLPGRLASRYAELSAQLSE